MRADRVADSVWDHQRDASERAVGMSFRQSSEVSPMRSRLLKFRAGLPDPEQDLTMSFPTVRLRAKVSRTTHDDGSAGMGRRNFIAEILDSYGALDKERKQELIDCARRLVQEQREGS
jgi:hypothetical protein